MSTRAARRKRPLPIENDGSDRDEPLPVRPRSNTSIDTVPSNNNDSIERLTTVMAALIEQRERSSVPTVKGDVIPDFNPDNKNQTILQWCQKVDELREIYKWNEEATIYFATTKLKGLAEVWYKSLPTLKFTWEEWKEKLNTAFPSRQDFNADLQEMMNRRKRPDENYTKYFYEKMALLNRCRIYGTDAVSCVIGGIGDIVVKTGAAAGNHQSLDSLFGYLSALSSLPSTSSTRNEHSAFKKHRRFDRARESKPSTSKANCYKCKQSGHYANSCPLNRREKDTVTCTFCHKKGHTEEKCFTKNKSIAKKI